MAYISAMSFEDAQVAKGRHPDVLEYRRKAALRYLRLKEMGAPKEILRNERRRIVLSLGHPIKRPFPFPFVPGQKRPFGS